MEKICSDAKSKRQFWSSFESSNPVRIASLLHNPVRIAPLLHSVDI